MIIAVTRIVGAISSGNDFWSKYLLSYDIIAGLHHCLLHKKLIIRRNVCWVISNLAASVF